jgi:hypothetical protein
MSSLTETEIQSFIAEGFVRIDGAFARDTADAARAILWAQTGCDSHDRATWKRAVIRLGDHGELGTFPIRFPAMEDPGDTGWHIERYPTAFHGPTAALPRGAFLPESCGRCLLSGGTGDTAGVGLSIDVKLVSGAFRGAVR